MDGVAASDRRINKGKPSLMEDETWIEVNPGSEVWDSAWSGLRFILNKEGVGPGDGSIDQYCDGEGWQLMGSYRQGSGIVHQFRHRDHPITKCREYRDVLTATGAEPELVYIPFSWETVEF
jgi:hypothetical protein